MCVYGKKNFMHYKNLFILGKWQVIKEDMGNSNVFYPRELDKHQRSIWPIFCKSLLCELPVSSIVLTLAVFFSLTRGNHRSEQKVNEKTARKVEEHVLNLISFILQYIAIILPRISNCKLCKKLESLHSNQSIALQFQALIFWCRLQNKGSAWLGAVENSTELFERMSKIHVILANRDQGVTWGATKPSSPIQPRKLPSWPLIYSCHSAIHVIKHTLL